VLAWLLGEPASSGVAERLAGAERVVASDLTVIECERVLIRAWSSGLLSEADAAARRATLARAATQWHRFGLGPEVTHRCRLPFPIEPVRTLDAIHLATALSARGLLPTLRLLTLDQRIRENGVRLGFDVAP
jgi:predicted nucleic acid-binding protein